jgi:CSLREA domain-containing protein
MSRFHLLPFLVPLGVLAACGDDQLTAPTPPEARPLLRTAAATRVVNSVADPGNGVCNASQCTLREAINDPASTNITFAAGLTGPITLAPPGTGGGRLEIDKPLTITGPSRRIVIRGQSPDLAFTIFRIGQGGMVTLTNLIIRDGGGVVNRGTLTLTNSVVAENLGSGISSRFGTFTLTKSFVVGNSGPGIEVVLGTATLINNRIAGNSGSGIRVFNATVTLTNSTVARNSAGDGGGIANEAGRLTIARSTITNNSATGQGGGILNTVNDPFRRQGASLTLTNSTVSGNSAGSGGGIANSPLRSGAGLRLTNSTVARNSATQEGGGIFQTGGVIEDEDQGFLALANSLLAQNSAPTGPDVLILKGAAFARFSLIGNGAGSGFTNTDGNQVGNVSPNGSLIDPKLGPLADNGGPTLTHALLLGSPAIDAASSADCPAKDQRGVSRPQGPACDIGSYERE